MSGSFVLAVAEARARALSGEPAYVHDGDDAAVITCQPDGTYAVEPAGLFPTPGSDRLVQRAADLLRRHA